MGRASAAFSTVAVVTTHLFMTACAKPPKPGDPLGGLTREERLLFERGQVEFERVFTRQTGLGPLFNANACAACHESPVSGGSGDEVEVHVSAFLPDGPVCDPLVQQGGPVIQQTVIPALSAALGIETEPVPTEATARAMRTTPVVFGFGLLDAVPDAVVLALADPDDRLVRELHGFGLPRSRRVLDRQSRGRRLH